MAVAHGAHAPRPVASYTDNFCALFHLPHLLLSSSYRVILFHLEREKYVFKFLYAIVNIIKIFLDNVKKDREYSIVYEIFIYKFEDEHFIVISEVKNNLIFNIFVNYMLRYNIIFIILIL